MSSHILRLRSYLSNPDSLNFDEDLVELDGGDLPSLLIIDQDLAHKILKSPNCGSYNLLEYWKKISRNTNCPALDRLFRETPFFLDGNTHHQINKTLTKPYKTVETKLPLWLPEYTRSYLQKLAQQDNPSAYQAIGEYIRQVFSQIMAYEFQLDTEEIPSFEAGRSLVLMFQDPENLAYFDNVVAQLYRVGTFGLKRQGRDEKDLSALLSITMMGREPLFAVILDILMNPPDNNDWDVTSILRERAPVSLLARRMIADETINGISLKSDQVINIPTFLVRPKSQDGCPLHEQRPSPMRSIEFGAGPHLCNGRSMTITILEIFFAEWFENPAPNLDFSRIRLIRDFVHRPKEGR